MSKYTFLNFLIELKFIFFYFLRGRGNPQRGVRIDRDREEGRNRKEGIDRESREEGIDRESR